MLMASISEISHLIYRDDVDRCPKLVLRLYNLTWLHHELCVDLFPQPKKITMAKMFGIYFHSLLVHAPRQYEVVSLSSANTEKQERLFGQARAAASSTSNRQPENVIKSILLHIQSRSLTKDSKGGAVIVDSRVSNLAKRMCQTYEGTSFPKSFIRSRLSSWQTHLERIASFLIMEPGYWWEESGQSVNFHDGDDHESYDKPQLLHFRKSKMSAATDRSKEAWNNILQLKVRIPATLVKIYDSKGDVTSTWNPSDICTPEVTPIEPTVMIPESSPVLTSEMTLTSFDPSLMVCPELSPVLTSDEVFLPHEVLSSDEDEDPPHIDPPQDEDRPADLVINAEEFMVPQSNQVSGSLYKTKLAKALAQLLGSSDDLKRLDEIRGKMK